MLRNTNQRQIILEELQGLTSHPSASVLHEIVRQRLPRISLATVYRNLELLTKLGLVKKLAMSGGETHFDAATIPHNHIRCLQCDRIDDIDIPVLRSPCVQDYSESTNSSYLIKGCNVEYYGLCPECQQQAANSDNINN
jgi:Fur family ferric uptake transcriptional regulator